MHLVHFTFRETMKIYTVVLFALAKSVEGWLFRLSSPEPRRVCFQSLGICYSDAPPYNNVPGFLPKSPERQGVSFDLFTQGHLDIPEPLPYDDDETLRASSFNARLNTKVIIHGFGEWGNKSWVRTMRDVILENDNVNVITVNWKEGAMPPVYQQSVANTRVVGEVIAKLITRLNYLFEASFESFHLIGHSLGAHVAGYAGRRIANLGRITGLDPAGPHFDNYGTEVILDATDATFVDIIHTNAKPLRQFGYGFQGTVGDADFFPNGGRDQPGCPDSLRGILLFLRGDIAEAVRILACSHERGVVYFIASISGTSFDSYPCASKSDFEAGQCNVCGTGCSQMGYYAHRYSPRGTYYLTTSSDWPQYPQDLSSGVLAAIN